MIARKVVLLSWLFAAHAVAVEDDAARAGFRMEQYDDHCYLVSFKKVVDGDPPKSSPTVRVTDAHGDLLFSARLWYLDSYTHDDEYMSSFCLRADLLADAEVILQYGNPATLCAPKILTIKSLDRRVVQHPDAK